MLFWMNIEKICVAMDAMAPAAETLAVGQTDGGKRRGNKEELESEDLEEA